MHKGVHVGLFPIVMAPHPQNLPTKYTHHFPTCKLQFSAGKQTVLSFFVSLNKKKHYIFELITRGVMKIQKIKSLNCKKISDREISSGFSMF